MGEEIGIEPQPTDEGYPMADPAGKPVVGFETAIVDENDRSLPGTSIESEA